MEFNQQLMEMVPARRECPADDLVSTWANAYEHDKVFHETGLFIAGGAETTRAVIGAICRQLALEPDVQRQLRDDPSLLETTAIEEFVRFVSPVLNMRRTVTRDHELNGQQLEAGDELLFVAGSESESALQDLLAPATGE